MPYLWQTSTLTQHCAYFADQPSIPYIEERRAADRTFTIRRADENFPPEAFPEQARYHKALKRFPHFLSIKYWLAVSERVRDIIVSLEDFHQFAEVKVYFRDGTPSECKYFCINQRRHLRGTIIVEKSSGQINRKPLPGDVPIFPVMKADQLAIDQEAIRGRHLWRTSDYYDSDFMSDELHDHLKQAKVSSLNYYHQRAESR